LDDLQADIARLELQISQARRKSPAVASAVVDTHATTAAGSDPTQPPTAG
jgi:hypothetical protein